MSSSGVLWLGIAMGLLIPAAFSAFEYSIERKAPYVTLTPFKRTRDPRTGAIMAGAEEVSFDPRHGHYMKCAEVLITLASASLVFIPTLHVSTLLPRLSFSIVLLGFTVVYGLFFMALLTYFYEMFLVQSRQLHGVQIIPRIYSWIQRVPLFCFGLSLSFDRRRDCYRKWLVTNF